MKAFNNKSRCTGLFLLACFLLLPPSTASTGAQTVDGDQTAAQQPAAATLETRLEAPEPAPEAVAVIEQTAPSKSPPRPWWQRLDGHGLSPNLAFIDDWSKNFRGGACSRGSVNRYLLKTSLELDGEKLLGRKGTAAFVSLYHHLGKHGAEYAGDTQGFSNIDADPRTYLYELWYQQEFAGGKVRLKIGKVDANTEFAAAESGADFLNSSMGYSPTIVGLPTYPQPRPSFNLFVQPAKHYDLRVGLYDTAGAGAMAISEAGRAWTLGSTELNSRIAAGFWRQTGRMPCFDGDQKPGTNGFYLVAEQDLWHTPSVGDAESRRGLAAFLQYGQADGDISSVTRHLGGGMNWRGPFSWRPLDSIGLGATWVRFTKQPEAGFESDGELALEMFYKVRISRFLNVSPDLQFIHQPGGLRCQRDTVIFTPRLTVSF